MPETQEAVEQSELEISIPAPSVPMREGEKERYGAALNLEDARRRESIISELQQQLKAMGGTSAGEVKSQFARSPSARKRQQLIIRKTQELKSSTTKYGDVWEGPCAPATVINLNPIVLTLYGQLQQLSIPAAGKGAKIELGFRGRRFIGSYVTISTPEVWLAATGVNTDPTGDSPAMEAKYIPPIGIAHQFYSHYCEGAPDAQHMGGILIFEGDIHNLDKPRLERSKRMVRMPEAQFSVDIPGDVHYSLSPIALDEFLARELAQQRAYAEAIIAQGHSYAVSQSDIVRNQLSNYHILWHNYALERGYIEAAASWASEKLKDSPLVQAVFCPDCRTRQEDPEQYFCRNCNSPFDAFKAFMAGKQVSPDRLAVYDEKSKEWNGILAEMNRRKAKLALLEGVSEPKKKA